MAEISGLVDCQEVVVDVSFPTLERFVIVRRKLHMGHSSLLQFISELFPKGTPMTDRIITAGLDRLEEEYQLKTVMFPIAEKER